MCIVSEIEFVCFQNLNMPDTLMTCFAGSEAAFTTLGKQSHKQGSKIASPDKSGSQSLCPHSQPLQAAGKFTKNPGLSPRESALSVKECLWQARKSKL